MTAKDNHPPINLPLGQLARWKGRLFTYKGRARDQLRSHVFVDEEGVPESVSDRELLLEQQSGNWVAVSPADLERAEQNRPAKRLDLTSPEELREVERRLKYVKAWDKAGRPPRTECGLKHVRRTVAEAISDPHPPSWRTMARWISVWLECGERTDALIPEKGGNRTDRLGAARDLLHDVVERQYLINTRPNATAVHRAVERAFDEHNVPLSPEERLPVPSLQAVLDEIRRIDRYTLDFCRDGPRIAAHRHRPVTSGPVTLRANDVWEVDHTRVDVIVVDAGSGLPIGRPWVTVLLDRASRAITGFRVSFEPPSAASLLDCLRIGVGLKDALLATVSGIRGAWRCCGAPKTLICDQGVEFKSKAFLEACLSLMIDVEYTPAFKAWYKGRIERFFRTLARDVFHRVPGSTFANFFERNKEEIPERVAVVTLDELRAFTLLYIVDVYNNRPHRALAGRSPQDLYDEMAGQQGMRLPPPADELAALTSPVAYRTVQRYGIEFEGLIYQAPVLASFRTQQERPDKVRIRVDRRDLTRIWFVDPRDGEDKPIPISPAMRPLVEGISLEKHRLARAMQLANPQRLAGEAGLKRAYRILDAAMAERSTQDGLQNRTKAARYWEILNRPPRPEEPAEFDVDRSSHSIVEAAITDAYPEDIGTADASSAEANPPDTAQGTMPQPDASPTADQTTSKPAPKRKRATPSRQVPPKDDAAETGQEEDVDELARRLNLRVSKQEGE